MWRIIFNTTHCFYHNQLNIVTSFVRETRTLILFLYFWVFVHSATTMDAEKLKKIRWSTKCIVFGYIRKCQQLLPSNKAYFNIPTLVTYTCLSYYYIAEYFDIAGGNTSISSDKRTAIKSHSSWSNSTFGKMEINSQSNEIYEWKIKLTKSLYGNLAIGITTKLDPNNGFLFERKASMYG